MNNPEINYYQECVALCRKNGWWATLTAITEEGSLNDGTDWEKLYKDWLKDDK